MQLSLQLVAGYFVHVCVTLWLLFGGHHSDMPPGTDCPYPIRIFAVFEMIRPYHAVIRI